MARAICLRLARMVAKEDRLQVELQSRIRAIAKRRLRTPAARKAAVLRVLGDEEIKKLLAQGRPGEAMSVAKKIIHAASEAAGDASGR